MQTHYQVQAWLSTSTFLKRLGGTKSIFECPARIIRGNQIPCMLKKKWTKVRVTKPSIFSSILWISTSFPSTGNPTSRLADLTLTILSGCLAIRANRSIRLKLRFRSLFRRLLRRIRRLRLNRGPILSCASHISSISTPLTLILLDHLHGLHLPSNKVAKLRINP
uniref:Uncharacterized protein n=1 Tax=Leersia perrieri TaxID=77586 RepID=A0A0D9VK19_9ORYZ